MCFLGLWSIVIAGSGAILAKRHCVSRLCRYDIKVKYGGTLCDFCFHSLLLKSCTRQKMACVFHQGAKYKRGAWDRTYRTTLGVGGNKTWRRRCQQGKNDNMEEKAVYPAGI